LNQSLDIWHLERIIALLVDFILVGEIVEIKDNKVILGHIPHFGMNGTKVHLHLSLPLIKRCGAIKHWWFAPNMVEHNMSHNLHTEVVKPSLNGDHGSDTT